MKKILSLFVTIALLTASMVYFTGCQNMADIHIDPFEQPESEPKHTVKLDYLKSMDLEYTTGEEVRIPISYTKKDHTFIGVTFVDANTGVALDVHCTQSWIKEKDGEVLRAYFTMPDADIILYRHIIESVPEAEKDRANVYHRSPERITRNFKIGYFYGQSYSEDSMEYVPEEHKNVVKKVKASGNYYWFYEITTIDISKLYESVTKVYCRNSFTGKEVWDHNEYGYYFSVSDLVTYTNSKGTIDTRLGIFIPDDYKHIGLELPDYGNDTSK